MIENRGNYELIEQIRRSRMTRMTIENRNDKTVHHLIRKQFIDTSPASMFYHVLIKFISVIHYGDWIRNLEKLCFKTLLALELQR